MAARPNDPPRLRAALNRPDASSAQSRATEFVAAWFRNSIEKNCAKPRTICAATSSGPDVWLMRSAFMKQLTPYSSSPNAIAARRSIRRASTGNSASIRIVGTPLIAAMQPDCSELQPGAEVRNCGMMYRMPYSAAPTMRLITNTPAKLLAARQAPSSSASRPAPIGRLMKKA